MAQARNVAVLIYEGVDTLDMAGPLDVFAVSSDWGKDLRVYTVAERAAPVTTVSGVTVQPRYALADCPAPDILVVPGGLGSRKEMHNERLCGWIREAAARAEIVLSVCTGALLLAKAGLLEGMRITTNRRAFDLLEEAAPASATIVREVRYVDNGQVVMSGGVTTGMDAALHVVARLFGEARARASAAMLEYVWQPAGTPAVDPSPADDSDSRDGRGTDTSDAASADVRDDRIGTEKTDPAQPGSSVALADLAFRQATVGDAEMLRELYLEAVEWIRDAKGIRQWNAEMFTAAQIERLLREQDVFAAYLHGKLAGCFSIRWRHEEIWDAHPRADAAYVHRLAVSRDCRGLGIGRLLLLQAERVIAQKGRTWLRLDCMAGNPGLNAFYARQGMQYRGRFDGEGWSASLYERKIDIRE